MKFHQHKLLIGHKAVKSILCLLTLFIGIASLNVYAQKATTKKPEIKPQIPAANRNQKNKVFLEHADSLVSGPKVDGGESYVVLFGLTQQVEFSKGDMILRCDSAHFYELSQSIDAYGNVSMSRPSKNISGHSEEAHYDDRSGRLTLTSDTAVWIRQDNMRLSSTELDYYRDSNTGTFTTGGKLVDSQNILRSLAGTFYFKNEGKNAREPYAVFERDVNLTDLKKSFDLNTDKIIYYPNTKLATLQHPTTIQTNDSYKKGKQVKKYIRNVIFSESGNYRSSNGNATLFVKNGVQPVIFDRDTSDLYLEKEQHAFFTKQNVGKYFPRMIKSDTIIYIKKDSVFIAKKNVHMIDTENKAILDGGYVTYNTHEQRAFATDKALAKIYNKQNARPGERSDTLFFHGDTITIYDSINNIKGKIDTARVLTATNGTQFYRKDVQGLCGFMKFCSSDSILHLYNHPIVWSDQRQISSDNEINVHMKDSSSVDWATLPNKGLIIEHLGEIYYDQISGDDIKAFFEKVTDYHDDGTQETRTEMRHADVKGKVKTLFFPMENDSTYNKCVRTESGFLSIDLKSHQEVEKIKMWPEVNGIVIPLYLAKNSQLKLDEYQWFDQFRPKKPYDVLNLSDEVKEMFKAPYTISKPESEDDDEDSDANSVLKSVTSTVNGAISGNDATKVDAPAVKNGIVKEGIKQ